MDASRQVILKAFLCRLMLQAAVGENEVYLATSDSDLARTMIAHELYHLLQVNAGGNAGADPKWHEAQAVFAATVAASDVEQYEHSLYRFWQRGYLANLDKGICWFDTKLNRNLEPLVPYVRSQVTGGEAPPLDVVRQDTDG